MKLSKLLTPVWFAALGLPSISFAQINQEIKTLERKIYRDFGVSIASENSAHTGFASKNIIPDKKDYLDFLEVFYEKASEKGLKAHGRNLSILVETENWNLGYFRPINTHGDFCQSNVNSFVAGAGSPRTSVNRLIDILEFRKENKLISRRSNSFGSVNIIRGGTASGCVTFARDSEYAGFLKDFQDKLNSLSEAKRDCVLQSGVIVNVIKENWNGGGIIPLNWGPDIESESKTSFEVGVGSASSLISKILKIRCSGAETRSILGVFSF